MRPSTPEERFLQCCLRARLDPETRLAGRSEDLNWDSWLSLVEQWALGPLVWDVVQGRGLVPEPVEKQLQALYRRNAARNTWLFHELEALLEHLNAADIPVMLLKGAGLAHAVYGNPALRPMMDIDILVPPDYAAQAATLLIESGFEPAHAEPRPSTLLTYESQVRLVRHHLTPIIVEVHWSALDSPYYQRRWPLDWFWETSRTTRIGRANARIPGPEAQLLHLAAHMLLHHHALLWLGLHDMAEVIHVYRDEIDWEAILARARIHELTIPLRLTLPEVIARWRLAIPGQIVDQICQLGPSSSERRIYAWLLTPREATARRFFIDLATLSGWRDRLHFAWIHLFPSLAYLQKRYQPAFPWLFPFYYPYRWLRGIRSLLRQ
ncbi:MAG: nucleotidyltransferase family protein [Chloroflexi bacterium]|nr:nucleotidyltransferase family protein [Chloroflexota bacterium]